MIEKIKKYSLFLLGFFLLLFITEVNAQFQLDTIKLTNPSFEDEPKNSVPPEHWIDCGFQGESPPDVHPINPASQGWYVTTKPQEGQSFMGMVVRDNDTWERASQPLRGTIKKGNCYRFSIYLAKSASYVSPSHITRQVTNYTTPTVLRIWGGNSNCDRQSMLGESKPVDNTTWEEYEFQFHPESDFDHLMLEAYYETPTLFPYNGNLLLDNASHIIRIPCNEREMEIMEELLAEISSDEEAGGTSQTNDIVQAEKPNPPKSNLNSGNKPPADQQKMEVEKGENKIQRSGPPVRSLGGYHKSQLEKGSLIRINRLYFEADAHEIKAESYDDLNQIAFFLLDNPEVDVEIGGHTNDLPSDEYCYQLSKKRARSVTEYLISVGVEEDRLTYKGYGKAQPIATNKTAVGRRMNQRVEIKILRIGD